MRCGAMITEKEKKMLIEMVRRETGCEICGSKDNLVIHHIIRKVMGGKDIPRNLQVVCVSCHKQLHYNEPGIRRR